PLPMAEPATVATELQLQMVDGFQRLGSDLNLLAVAQAAQVQLTKRPMPQTGLLIGTAGAVDAMNAHVLIDVIRHPARIGLMVNNTFGPQQTDHDRHLADTAEP